MNFGVPLPPAALQPWCTTMTIIADEVVKFATLRAQKLFCTGLRACNENRQISIPQFISLTSADFRQRITTVAAMESSPWQCTQSNLYVLVFMFFAPLTILKCTAFGTCLT